MAKLAERDFIEVFANMSTWASENGYSLTNEDMSFEDITEFVERKLTTLQHRAEASARRAEKKASETPDELVEIVYTHITSEPKTAKEITRDIGLPEVSPQKVTPRLTKLVKMGKVVKEQVTIPPETEGGRVRQVYVYSRA